MTSMEKLVSMGEKFGLTGKPLMDWVTEKQKEERHEREAVRQAEKEKSEASLLTEREKTEAAFLLEKERRAAEQEKIQAEQYRLAEAMKLESIALERAKLEKEAKWLQLKATAGPSTGMKESESEAEEEEEHEFGGKQQGSRGPRIPAFDEAKDDLDSYLFRFERYATIQKWKKIDWAIYLSALLKGKALEVYSRLPIGEAHDYDKLKLALLKRFQLTEDGFKDRFRSTKPTQGESPEQFLTRLGNYFLRWIEMAKVKRTYEGLFELMVREQYISTCSKDLALFLKERKPETLDELAKIAEQYLEAHPNKGIEQRESKPVVARSQLDREPQRPNAVRSGTVKRCWVCNKSNHIARNCFFRHKAAGMHDRFAVSSTQGRLHPQGLQYKQQQEAETIPKSTGVEEPREFCCRAHMRNRCTDCMVLSGDGHRCNAMLADFVELKCGCVYPVIADACSSGPATAKMPVVEGYVGRHKVRVLRDTGCSTVVVRRELVSEELLTGQEETCILIDGTIRRTPVAIVDINTPYLKGRVRAVCMRNPLYDVIIGNVKGVLDLQEVEVTGKQGPEVGQAVITRQQARQQHDSKPLKVSDSVDVGVSKDELMRLQKADEALKHIWQKMKEEEDAGITQQKRMYQIRKGVLCRRIIRKGGQEGSQLVVPTGLQQKVMALAHE